MKTKIQIKSIFGDILFEYEKEYNTIRNTVVEAVRNGISLHYADLRGANLRNANLLHANLYGADLQSADLSYTDLRDAILCDTNLVGTYLHGAKLCGAKVGEFGKLSNNQDILTVGPIGSRSSYTTIFHTDKGIFVQCGCFKGTLNEFVSKVKEVHKGNKHEQDYLALVEFVKLKFK